MRWGEVGGVRWGGGVTEEGKHTSYMCRKWHDTCINKKKMSSIPTYSCSI